MKSFKYLFDRYLNKVSTDNENQMLFDMILSDQYDGQIDENIKVYLENLLLESKPESELEQELKSLVYEKIKTSEKISSSRS